MRTTALIPLKIGGKVQRINPKWTDNCPKCTLLDTRNRSCKRVGINNIAPNALKYQGFGAFFLRFDNSLITV